MDRVLNKVAAVTGGASGLGMAAAEMLAEEGAKIAILDISDANGLALEEKLKSAGKEAKYWRMDVTNLDSIEEVMKQVNDYFGKIDILVNCAGLTGSRGKIDECTEADFDAVFNIDVKGLFFCIKYVIPYMRANGSGSIINLSSISGGKVTSPTLACYHAAKGAVNQITKHAAISYAPDRIRCNAVLPCTTLTPLIEKYAVDNYGSLKAYEEFAKSFLPMGFAQVEDIAYAILFLASDESKHCTGMMFNVDGGTLAQ